MYIIGPTTAGGEQIVAKYSTIDINSNNYYKYYQNTQTQGCSAQLEFKYLVVPSTCATYFSSIEIGTSPPSLITDKSGISYHMVISPTPIKNISIIDFILPTPSLVSSFSTTTMNQTLNLILKSIKF